MRYVDDNGDKADIDVDVDFDKFLQDVRNEQIDKMEFIDTWIYASTCHTFSSVL